MDPATATLIVGLSTVVASGLTSSVVTYRLNRNKEQTLFLRDKAEKLYLAADEFGKNMAGMATSYFPLLKGKIDYNEMLDLQLSGGSAEKKYGGAETMTMLTEIYFPSARSALRNVWDARDALHRCTTDIKNCWIAQGTLLGSGLLPPFRDLALEVDRAIEALKDEIVKAARSHAGVKQ